MYIYWAYINIQWCVSQTQQNFIMFIIVLGQHVSILTQSSSGPSKKIDPFLEGPEDDSIRIETCCPNTIINIIKFCCVWLTHHCIFIYVINNSGWQTLKKSYWAYFVGDRYNFKGNIFSAQDSGQFPIFRRASFLVREEYEIKFPGSDVGSVLRIMEIDR